MRYLAAVAAILVACAVVPAAEEFPRQLGEDNPKIRKKGGRVLVWAGGGAPETTESEWYDFTGAPFPPEELQFGIGKDRIRAIDDPLFVAPDDPRLLKYIPPSPYRTEERPTVNDELRVIGWVGGKLARAYPIALLDRHELVNDIFLGKPVTVGW